MGHDRYNNDNDGNSTTNTYIKNVFFDYCLFRTKPIKNGHWQRIIRYSVYYIGTYNNPLKLIYIIHYIYTQTHDVRYYCTRVSLAETMNKLHVHWLHIIIIIMQTLEVLYSPVIYPLDESAHRLCRRSERDCVVDVSEKKKEQNNREWPPVTKIIYIIYI